jgi:aspartate-semialdehyde dehydrogenase
MRTAEVSAGAGCSGFRPENAASVTILHGGRNLRSDPAAATEAANRDTVCVCRIREDLAPQRGLNLWIVTHNVNKAAANLTVHFTQALARRLI